MRLHTAALQDLDGATSRMKYTVQHATSCEACQACHAVAKHAMEAGRGTSGRALSATHMEAWNLWPRTISHTHGHGGRETSGRALSAEWDVWRGKG